MGVGSKIVKIGKYLKWIVPRWNAQGHQNMHISNSIFSVIEVSTLNRETEVHGFLPPSQMI
jgi:hypothetical protein